MSVIQAKRRVQALLRAGDVVGLRVELERIPRRQAVNPLFSGLCHGNATIRWQAIIAMGWVVADLADQDMEAARVVMRRCMWSLNDESGGIGWGAPEAMAEIMASHRGLAEEYGHILVAFMRQDGFFLELEPLQRGLMWGLGRMAAARPAILRRLDAVQYLLPYLQSVDGSVRGLAARALGLMGAVEAVPQLAKLRLDPALVRFYDNGLFHDVTVGQLVIEALAAINNMTKMGQP